MVFQNDILAGAAGAGDGYQIDQSIRFNDNDSAYLSRTSTSADSDRKFASVSMWLKRCTLTSRQNFYSINSAGSNGASNQISMAFENSGTNGDCITYNNGAVNRQSTSVYRDVSGWYHFCQIFDTTQATAADRVKTYINGNLLTDINIGQDFSLNSNTPFGQSSVVHYIGRRDSGFYYDGYMAEIVFTVGQSVAVTDFGEYNDDGVWIPKAYAGPYGTNGFYITGEDSADLGADYSGNGNDFTSSGLTASDQMPDSPTNNYGTLNSLTGVNSGSSVVTEANGNLEATMTANYVGTFGTLGANSGKYYFEYSYAADANYNDGRLNGGVVCVETSDHGYFRIDGGSFYFPDRTTEGNYMILHKNGSGQLSNTGTGRIAYNTSLSSASATGGPESGPDIYMVALDLDNNNIYWGKNGTWYGSGGTSGSAYTDATPAGILSTHQGKYFAPAFWFNGATSGTTTVLNCGQDATFGGRYSSPAGDFYYTPPIGFSALSTANLPEPAIADGSAYFQTTTYTGAGYPTEVNQLGNSTFQPDFVWVKRRNGATTHDLFDAVRGVSSQLYSNLTNAEGTVSNAISFDADGFTAAADPITGDTGSSGNTFVGWQWLAANGTASNTDGSITSTVSANVAAGFSVIGWTGNGTSGATIGHGLSAAPELFIVKNRTNSDFWAILETVYYGATHYLTLPSTSGSNSNSTFWTNTNPTSSVITLGTQNRSNGSGDSMIGYAWHSVEGFSKIGSYTGNGSTDGPFIFTGFRPAFVIFKKINGTDSWEMFDSTRPGYNVTNLGLLPNTTNSEITGRNIDILSNGIKQRNANGTTNENGNTYMYMAFAENPFGGDGVAPVPAR